MTDRILASARQRLVELHQQSKATGQLRASFLSQQYKLFCEAEPRHVIAGDVLVDVLADPMQTLRAGRNIYDVLIVASHVGDESFLFDLRNAEVARFYFVWFWDNHHHPVDNLRAAMLADVVFPSHWYNRQYLNHPCVLPGVHVAACSRQWSPQLIAKHYPDGMSTTRSDAIYGGYGLYAYSPRRNEFIKAFAAQHPNAASVLGDVNKYFEVPIQERLRQWVSHKVHLVVPVNCDLSSRVFEALITGQIPIVPDDVTDLDRVVPADVQRSLPIIRYKAFDINSATLAYRHAIDRFNVDGAAGVQRRFEFASQFHSLGARLKVFADFIRDPAKPNLTGSMQGWSYNWDTW